VKPRGASAPPIQARISAAARTAPPHPERERREAEKQLKRAEAVRRTRSARNAGAFHPTRFHLVRNNLHVPLLILNGK
jgi:hypothetical protein